MDQPAPATSARRRWLSLFRLLRNSLAVYALLTIGYSCCFRTDVMVSGSMAPTLQGEDRFTGDWVLTEKVSLWVRSPRRWEVIAFVNRDNDVVMKRVVGLPGETVQMHRDGQLLVDGVEIDPPSSLQFLRYFPYGNLTADQIYECGDGYYVLGDESRDSDDSRFQREVASDDIIGRPVLILNPAERRGWVQP